MDENIEGKEDVDVADKDGIDTTVVDFDSVRFCDIVIEIFFNICKVFGLENPTGTFEWLSIVVDFTKVDEDTAEEEGASTAFVDWYSVRVDNFVEVRNIDDDGST